jgi:hypothetical protein
VNFSQLTPTLQRFHSILPNLAAIACPSTIPQEQRCHYFLTTLSPKRAHARFKEAAARYQDFHCPKNHKGCPHNMITNDSLKHLHLYWLPQTSFPQQQTSTKKQIYTSQLILLLLHVPSTYPIKPNIECHPSKVFSMIGYDITVTNVTPPLPTNQDPPSSLVSRLYH